MRSDYQQALAEIETFRAKALDGIPSHHRSKMGQFFTPVPIARFMSSMFAAKTPAIRILDAGSGVGVLFASCVFELCSRPALPESIDITAFESEPRFAEYLEKTMAICDRICHAHGISFSGKIIQDDFVRHTIRGLQEDLFEEKAPSYSLAILNPPYKKISSQSETRALLNSLNLETTNLYSAFVWLAAAVLEQGGELVAITPRSFCNGPYFRNFRKAFLGMMGLDRIHVFESRDQIFQGDDVLQENVIFHAIKGRGKPAMVTVSTSDDPEQGLVSKEMGYDQIVYPGDKDSFIHIPIEHLSDDISRKMADLPASVGDLGLTVSTGRVVDFRAKDYLREIPAKNTSPLIYPAHFSQGYVEWPKLNGKKPNALEISPATTSLLVPSGYYVLARRFSAKEEARRIVAAIHDPQRVTADQVGFENHLNYYHAAGGGIDPKLAKGLALYLNSSFVDHYFRQFNGHTQVNATDLRKIRYPAKKTLILLGSRMNDHFPAQDEIDSLVESELFSHGQKEILGKSH